MNFQEGEILCFDKPYRWTSFDVVGRIRRLLCRKMGVKKLKVGHAGTLDPLATGVLIVCTGRATKQIESLQAGTKEYVATLRLGATTPSFDLEQEIDQYYPYEHITRSKVEAALQDFLGEQEQVPPVFSAKIINGLRAYEYARAGEPVELRKSLITIFELELLDFTDHNIVGDDGYVVDDVVRNIRNYHISHTSDGERPAATIRIKCSKGTYIRSLARDLGLALNSGAYLTSLRRTASGPFKL